MKVDNITSKSKPNLSQLMNGIKDPLSMKIFEWLILYDGKIATKELITIMEIFHLTKKQYYANLRKLIDLGLIKRHQHNSYYKVTLFGRAIFKSVLMARKAIDCYWQLGAVDSLYNSSEDIPLDKLVEVVKSLIKDDEIRNMVLSS
jgi:hypothetical protein